MKLPYSLFLFLLISSSFLHAQRIEKAINSGWEFQLENQEESTTVNIPHSWNSEDAFNDGAYFRGKGTYSKEIFIPQDWNDKAVFLKFEGANQFTKAYVNDQLVGEHTGGYTSFVFELTEHLNFGQANQVRIELDNSHNQDIPPLEADFNFYGGIYRDLQLVVTGKSHFTLEGLGAGTQLIKTPEVSENLAKVKFEGNVVTSGKDLELQVSINDPSGNQVSEYDESLNSEDFSIDFEIDNPKLWSPDDPNLYLLTANLIDPDSGEILDTYISNFGCRWFEADPEKGFILNGKPIKLIGANRHQDFENMGNAVPNSIHRKDYQMIKDMGANFIRTAHYPQDPDVYRICDELGLLVWTEVPVINDVTDSEAYHQNAVNMQKEQILQLYNHPSIVFWGIMNEIFIRLVFTRDIPEADQKAKIKTSVELAEKLEAATKELDTTRLSVMALHENDIYNTSGIADITDVIGWNLYFGWYTPGLKNLGKFLDEQHQKYPDRPLLISEYGPGSDSRIQTNDPKPWDFSEAYQLKSHVSYLNQVMERDYMLGMAAWNFADFGSSGRQDSRPYINQKGLVNFDREPKDVYYYYKARLTEDDFVYIAGKNFETRIIDKSEKVKLKVFSNSDRVKLVIDEKVEKEASVTDNIAEFELDLEPGEHSVKAMSGDVSHIRNLLVKFRNSLIADIANNPMLINVGSHSDFVDDETGEIWISDQAFQNNDFGFVGGEVFQQSSSKFQGTASNIKVTTKEPLFQTMREGLQAYKFDVPKGQYRISLLMAEPNRGASRENIYNLGSDSEKSSEGIRSFDILINGILVEKDLNLARDYGILQAVEVEYKINSEGPVEIEFRPQNGKPVLSGIKLENL
ncbi:malectin domain-containing carbohydrate-binding protein [Gramella sp. GC03-9]|uniref:Malectin domain-containing carbohydrate-binding protein n=1 Tax=Christiangramia oceanisediminis TaxID=2920386 RepID=A0A9X2I876_9FLAO|nr:glycoside hydrolase family 2 TIM barrel-domain containing protein [Gramella oceanisediminis]MCP9198473.1 malectin domain-containing carbohydrate-binding protein [Gramella oceanisediminis]